VRLSIAYITCRLNPRLDWFCDSLLRQLPEQRVSETELVVIDGGLWKGEPTARRRMVDTALKGRLNVVHLPPKDGLYQGPRRRTSGEYFSAANARNTALAAAQGSYVVFVDDLSILMPGWYARVEQAIDEGYVVGGSYHKHRDMIVENGLLLESKSDSAGIDSRWSHGSDEAPVPMGGGWLYGCSFGAPVETLLAVNGMDELCDCIGGEDYQLGLRLERAGFKLFYDRRMWTVESDELHSQPYLMKRINPTLPEPRYLEKLAQFGVSARATQGATDASFMILDILYGRGDTWTVLNSYNLREIRQAGAFPPLAGMPDTFWFDDTPLAEM
jgi:hypothetical protein